MFRGMEYRAFDVEKFIGPEKVDGSHQEGVDIRDFEEEVGVEEGGYNGNMEYDGNDYEGGDNVEFEEDGDSGQSEDFGDFDEVVGDDEGVDYGDMEEDGSDEEGVDYGDMEECGSDAEGVDRGDMEEDGIDDEDQYVQADSVEDIVALDLSGLWSLLVRRIEFGSLDLAYELYKSYGRANEFSIKQRQARLLQNGRTSATHICFPQARI
jgi:hypothetical protein